MELDMITVSCTTSRDGVKVVALDCDCGKPFDAPVALSEVIDEAMKHLARDHGADFFPNPAPSDTPLCFSLPPADPDGISQDSHGESPSPSVTAEAGRDGKSPDLGCAHELIETPVAYGEPNGLWVTRVPAGPPACAACGTVFM